MTINKTIHYCWFGRNPLPQSAVKCIESWKKMCPNYKIIEWNEDNFDYASNQYALNAYESGKYAFVSDYARLKVLYDNGGIYLDTDVEIIKSLDNLVSNQFLGFETMNTVNPGLIMNLDCKNEFCKDMLLLYDKLDFFDEIKKGQTVVHYVTDYFVKSELVLNNTLQEVNNILIYPTEYFNPRGANYGKPKITQNTYTIHNFDASWKNKCEKLLHEYRKKLGPKFGTAVFCLCHPIKALRKRREKNTK